MQAKPRIYDWQILRYHLRTCVLDSRPGAATHEVTGCAWSLYMVDFRHGFSGECPSEYNAVDPPENSRVVFFHREEPGSMSAELGPHVFTDAYGTDFCWYVKADSRHVAHLTAWSELEY